MNEIHRFTTASAVRDTCAAIEAGLACLPRLDGTVDGRRRYYGAIAALNRGLRLRPNHVNVNEHAAKTCVTAHGIQTESTAGTVCALRQWVAKARAAADKLERQELQ